MGELSLRQLQRILTREENYTLTETDWERVRNSYHFLEEFSKGKIIYGINTGFGPMAQYRIADEDVEQLQYNLIRSHSNGAGQYLDPDLVRISMVCRLNSLALGRSGVSEGFLKVLEQFIHKDIIPCIPEHGGVGASGDLVQLAHMTQTLIGEGKVYFKGEVRPTGEVLKETGIAKAELKIRDGLGSINGTSFMSGISAINLILAKNLISWAIQASSIMNELTASYDDSFSEELNSSKKHIGQQEVARIMRDLLHDSKILKKRSKDLFDQNQVGDKAYFEQKVQEYYSLRCVPQIIGPVLDAWQYAREIIEDEINSANDNPVISMETQSVFHGGNFHGDYISYEMDKIRIGITKLTMLLERQLNFLLNSRLNQEFPPFLNAGKLGFNFGLQGIQFTAVSTTAENQTLSTPMSIHSIPNNGDNQDIVSMGTNSALLTRRVIHNSFKVLSIHMVAICQAIDLGPNLPKMSSATNEFYTFVREKIPMITTDQSISESLEYLVSSLVEHKKDLF